MPADINAEIDRELERAKARWGETFDLKCLEGSRGDTLAGQRFPSLRPRSLAASVI
jgi:hypothetical protein